MPAMKLAAMSWKANPSARPRMPAPASSEATVFCNPRMPREMNRPVATRARKTVCPSSRLTCSLCETRRSRRCRRLRASLASSQKPTSTATATARFGSSRMKSRIHPITLAASRFHAFSTSTGETIMQPPRQTIPNFSEEIFRAFSLPPVTANEGVDFHKKAGEQSHEKADQEAHARQGDPPESRGEGSPGGVRRYQRQRLRKPHLQAGLWSDGPLLDIARSRVGGAYRRPPKAPLSQPRQPLLQPRLHLRPLLVQDAVEHRVADGAVRADLVFAEHPFAPGAELLDGPLALQVVAIGRELDPQGAQVLEGVPQQQELALRIDAGPLEGLGDPGAADLQPAVLGTDVEIARGPQRLARPPVEDDEEQGVRLGEAEADPVREGFEARVAQRVQGVLEELEPGPGPHPRRVLQGQRLQADRGAFEDHGLDVHEV